MSRILTQIKTELLRADLVKLALVPSRTKYYNNRHRDPNYRKERARKVWRFELPDFDKYRNEDPNLTPDQIRAKFKEKGIAPPRPYEEREVYTPSTMGLIEPFKPTDEDGKSSSLLDRVKSPISGGTDLIKNRRAVSVIKSFEGEDFDLKEFARQSTDIYIKAHEALANKDETKIFDYVTEHCFPMMKAGLKYHTIVWKYLDDIEPPVAMQVRAADLISKSNKYAQITVRFHTRQILAVYDRHGRLTYGSPTDVKEVFEYVVFEKYLANEYGLWRVHERIRPSTSTQTLSTLVPKTYVVTNLNTV